GDVLENDVRPADDDRKRARPESTIDCKAPTDFTAGSEEPPSIWARMAASDDVQCHREWKPGPRDCRRRAMEVGGTARTGTLLRPQTGRQSSPCAESLRSMLPDRVCSSGSHRAKAEK